MVAMGEGALAIVSAVSSQGHPDMKMGELQKTVKTIKVQLAERAYAIKNTESKPTFTLFRHMCFHRQIAFEENVGNN